MAPVNDENLSIIRVIPALSRNPEGLLNGGVACPQEFPDLRATRARLRLPFGFKSP